jgi:hypothetical protein
MIQPFEPSGGQAAIGADPRLVIYLNLPGLHTTDENEGAPPRSKICLPPCPESYIKKGEVF